MSRRLTAALAAGVLGAVVLAPAAQAGDVPGPRLQGTWNSASLRQDGVGYAMTLSRTSVPGSYAASVRMTFQDGTKGPVLRGRVVLDGVRASLRLPGEGTVRGTLGQDGSLFFPRCGRVLDDVVASAADQMCLFQQFPR